MISKRRYVATIAYLETKIWCLSWRLNIMNDIGLRSTILLIAVWFANILYIYKIYSLPQPDIWLGTSKLQFVDRVEILGREFSHNLSTQDHISSRMQSSRRAMFGMGISNEGISPSVKASLWESVGVPSLVYALGTCNINQSDLKRLESFQGTVIKKSLCIWVNGASIAPY